jgi:ribosomal protein L29
MAVIKKNELSTMSRKAIEEKILELKRTILELHGEGKKEKVKPLKKAIAKLKTMLSLSEKNQGLNIPSK